MIEQKEYGWYKTARKSKQELVRCLPRRPGMAFPPLWYRTASHLEAGTFHQLSDRVGQRVYDELKHRKDGKDDSNVSRFMTDFEG